MFVLPVIAFLFFSIIYFGKKRNAVESIAVSWLFVTLCTWTITEFFSVFSLIHTFTAAFSWCIICIFLVICGIRFRSFHQTADFIIQKYKNGEYKFDANIICVIVFCFFIGVIAILRSQDMFDNVYHRLAKIMHWIQNGNVGFFATYKPEEILYSQLVEYMNMHVYLLKGSDRFISIVQVGAYLCSACCVYGISRKLDITRKFAWLSVWIYLLIPAVIIETMTTQTDVAAGAYLLCFIYFLLDYIKADKLVMDRRGAVSAACLAVSAMFGYLAKPTVCFAMVVFFLWMCVVRFIKKDKFMILIQYAVIGMMIALILFLPSYIRKKQYVSYVGIETDSDIYGFVTTAIKDPSVFAAVAIRNLAANSTSRCFPKVNSLIERVVEKCDGMLHYESDRGFREMVSLGLGETSEPSPVIMFFCIISWICIISRLSKVNRLQFIYFICATLAMVIQSGLMDYSYFRQRYLIGVMAALCPAFGMTLEQIRISLDKKMHIVTAMIVISGFGVVNLLTYEIPYVVFGFRGGELHGHFINDSVGELYYGLALTYINENGYRTVGMSGNPSNEIVYEYVLWQGIDNLERMEHVNIVQTDFASDKLEDYDFIPDCIVMTDSPEYIGEGDIIECHGQVYSCGWRADNEESGMNYAVMVRQ